MTRIVALARADVDTLLEWAAAEGWNPGDEAEVFWNTDPQAYLGVRDDDGRLIGAVATVDYGGRLGVMGLFIVAPPHRGRGLGRQLWYHGRDTLLERLEPGAPIAIDAQLVQQGSSDTGKDTAKILGTAAAGAIIGHQVNHKNGSVVGGILGGAAGTAVAANTGGEVSLPAGTVVSVALGNSFQVAGD